MAILAGATFGVAKDKRCSRCGGKLTLEQEEYDWVLKCLACGCTAWAGNRAHVSVYRFRNRLLVGSLPEAIDVVRQTTARTRVLAAPLARGQVNGQ